MHVPVMDRTPEEPPPFVVLVQGPPGVRACAIPRVWHWVYASLARLHRSEARTHFTSIRRVGRHIPIHPNPTLWRSPSSAAEKKDGVQPGSIRLSVSVTGSSRSQWGLLGVGGGRVPRRAVALPEPPPLRPAILTAVGTPPVSSHLPSGRRRRRNGSTSAPSPQLLAVTPARAI